MRELNRMEYWNGVFDLECASFKLALHEKVDLKARTTYVVLPATKQSPPAHVAPRLHLL